jgi:hypothetical protein
VGCASLIGWVFLASALSKLRHFGEFRRSLPALAPVRPGLVRPLAAAVAAAEAAVPVLLLIRPVMSYGFALGGGLLGAFTAAIAAAMKHGRRAPCRCFGASSTPLRAGHLIRNAILLTAAAAGGLARGAPPPVAGVTVALAAGSLAAILVVAFDDLVYLFARTS